jgi:hypothetical protein
MVAAEMVEPFKLELKLRGIGRELGENWRGGREDRRRWQREMIAMTGGSGVQMEGAVPVQ